ncbi:MAG: hypothetical protein AUF65_02630 [Chloroflexi bacterium 13_1_20CM_50_12]|nr:MAG: hypothetical protein AUF65_02630 [Chloroflexi bacterium 13_1_20CM_50_12]
MNGKVRALEDMAQQFKRIGEDLLSILQEDIGEEQKVQAVNMYFKTLLFTSTITEASTFLSHEEEDTQKTSSIPKA